MEVADQGLATGAGASTGTDDVHQKIGSLTRQLHTALNELGFADPLRGSMGELPDAQSRLSYIARLTGEAAEKVLNHVEGAKSEQELIAQRGRQLAATIASVPGLSRAMPELQQWAAEVVETSEKSDSRLTEIMMAQDFHDLTGQVIARVVQLAGTIEEQLLGLLLQSAPSGTPGQDKAYDMNALEGPVVDAEGRTDVVTDQKDVDDLLASMGF